MAAVLEVVHTLALVALAQFLPCEADHHGPDPLLADDGILGRLEGLGVVVGYSVEGGRHRRLLALEELGFGGGHDDSGGRDAVL